MAPWCGHCKALAPAWEAVGNALASEKSVMIAKVDCTVEADLCSKYDVSGYPTLKYWKIGESAAAGHKGNDYNGGRDEGDLKSFVTDKANGMINSCSVYKVENLAEKSDPENGKWALADLEGKCDKKVIDYVKKWAAKDGARAAIEKELKRLGGMKSSNLTAKAASWLSDRKSALDGLLHGSVPKDELSELDDDEDL